MSFEIEKIAKDYRRNTKGDIGREDLYREIGIQIITELNAKKRIPDANRIKEFIKNGNLTERSKSGKLTEATTPNGPKDIVDIVLEYKQAIRTFQGSEREVRDTRSEALENGVIASVKKGLGMDQLKSEFDYLKPTDIEAKMKNASLADMVIMATQFAQLAPLVGDIGGGFDGVISAYSGINVEGAKLTTLERSLNGIFGVLGIIVVGGLASRAYKAGKIKGLLESFGVMAKYLPEKIKTLTQSGGKLPESVEAMLGKLFPAVRPVLLVQKEKLGVGDPKKIIKAETKGGLKSLGEDMKKSQAEVRSHVPTETVLKNAALPDAERLTLTGKLLGRELTEVQQKAILHTHTKISKGVYKNNPEDIQKIFNELEKAGFQVKKGKAGEVTEARILMENGILGKIDEQDSGKISNIQSIDIEQGKNSLGFDAQAELEVIKKLPKAAKAEAMINFKKQMYEQLKAVVELKGKIKEFSETLDFANLSSRDIKRKVIMEKFINEISILPKNLYDEILGKIMKYVDKKKQVHTYIEDPKYKNNPKQLLADHVGIPVENISGEIRAEISGSAIIFYVDPRDYNKVKSPSDTYSHHQIPTSGGFVSPTSKLNGLDNSVAVISGEKGGPGVIEVVTHELQHIDNVFLMPDHSTKYELIPGYKDLFLNASIGRGKDEIIAYMSTGTQKNITSEILTNRGEGAAYDYFGKVKKLDNIFPNIPATYDERLAQQYEVQLRKGIDLAYDMKRTGIDTEALAITPMNKWHRLKNMQENATLIKESKITIYPDGSFDGTREFTGGIKFEGRFNKEEQLMVGEKHFSNGEIEKGTFQNNILIEGEITTKEYTYIGKFDDKGQLVTGSQTFSNGLIIGGIFKDGKTVTLNKLGSTNGDMKEGVFNEKLQSLKGKTIFPNGTIYDGLFYESGELMKGKKIYPDGTIEEGFFDESGIGKIIKGKISYSNGDIFEGVFDGGILSFGKIIQNGYTAEGEFGIVNGVNTFLNGAYIKDGISTIIKDGKIIG